MRGREAVACAAAGAASVGDLLLLWVANAGRAALPALDTPPVWAVAVGTWLGVLAIPLYGLGYDAVANRVRGTAGTWVRRLGAAGAVLGAVIHGMTGIAIAADRAAGMPPVDPVVALLRYGWAFVPLWGTVGVATVLGSVVLGVAVWRDRTAWPRWIVAVLPAVLIVACGIVGTACGAWGEAFVVPAGPNLAHVAFFGAVAAAAPSRR